MDIKIITCIRAQNFGAVLQAYALQESIKKLSHNVKIIDYYPQYFKTQNSLINTGSYASKNIILRILYLLIKLPLRLKLRYIYNSFIKDLSPTKQYYSNEGLKNKFDNNILVCGSDQIWCQTKPTGKDPTMFLSFANYTNNKISYAASFGSESTIGKNEYYIKKRLDSFSAISVREDIAIDILNKMGIFSKQVLDPVFLLSKKDWIKFQEKSKINLGHKYLFIYPISTSNINLIINIAKYIADKLNLQILLYTNKIGKKEKGIKYIHYASPYDFVNLIYNSSYVITNSFHGTAFSLIFNKMFYSCDTNIYKNIRVQSILRFVGLDKKRNITNITEINLKDELSYTIINNLLSNGIKESQNFLINSITNNQN